MKRILIAALLAALTAAAHAQPANYKHDLENCRFSNGLPMDRVECDALRRRFAADAAAAARREADNKAALERREAAQAAQRESRAKEALEIAQEREQQSQRQGAELARVEARIAAEEREYEAGVAREQAERKKRCGADYKKPRMGMPIARVHECVSQSFELVARSQTAQGEVLTYQAPGGYIQTVDDKVISWGYTKRQ